MIQLASRNSCTGCCACVNTCSHNSIRMAMDDEGFEYPVIDKQNCIGCHQCEKSCPSLKKIDPTTFDKSVSKMKTYAMKNKNKRIKQYSSSGGIFSLLAENIINAGGIVYGAGFDTNYDVFHVRIEQNSELDKLRGSKYVQSKIGDIFLQVKKDLDKGKLVLFSGTPCQIGGLRSFLKHDFDYLLCIDILCHGVPSPKVWRKYIKENNLQTAKVISFRDKESGWSKFSFRAEMEKGTILEKFYENTYFKIFLSDICLRPSCYQCKYKNLYFEGDIVLADFWGSDKVVPALSDEEGVSLVFVNSLNGEEIINKILSNTTYCEVEVREAIRGNIQAIKGAKLHPKRDVFFTHLDDYTLEMLKKKYVENNLAKRIFRVILRNLKATMTRKEKQ